MGYQDELLVLGLPWDKVELTRKSYLVALSFLKASFHVFEDGGIPKREGFDLFQPNQLICLSVGSMNKLKAGSSVSRRFQIYSCDHFTVAYALPVPAHSVLFSLGRRPAWPSWRSSLASLIAL
jgi:hypothetical protein